MADSKDGFEQLDVRAKWKDEARDFTPWLAENIEVLGDALGMKLKTCQTELPIGRFFLDILAREIDEDVAIAIENQLEETDLHHLGSFSRTRPVATLASPYGWRRSLATSMPGHCTCSTNGRTK